ncbi:hypothetical protein KFL_013550010 [Klebsormidium nitens]|uniref:Reverse transcriptase Ty1/copia-type domain-containing protein n=1 Tax=Klebsormidium nitens TaxID=105231 RepID=A0A1Y1IWB1_KLENI|nr:hypothetical protein KFL_013550010 [Klebsormidium nitens]|eukprot:GAQ93196.1 hypothetical protein KFL_013550010 [Klebsormidium nitens]
MDEEMQSLLENRTWELAKKPEGVKPVPMKWVYKIKRDAFGIVERYKSRMVAKGYLQKQGIDFEEIYAPVTKHTTLRALPAAVAERHLELHQLDVKPAFLKGELEEEIRMQHPQGYEQGGFGMVCRLKRIQYGLRQAPRVWHTRLKEELEDFEFVAFLADAALFSGVGNGERVYLIGSAEQLNRTLEERARALQGCDVEAGGFCGNIVIASYTQNRVPSSVYGKLPWEMFYGEERLRRAENEATSELSAEDKEIVESLKPGTLWYGLVMTPDNIQRYVELCLALCPEDYLKMKPACRFPEDQLTSRLSAQLS